jgi:hypothetical protein
MLKQTEIFNFITDYGISMNQFYILSCIQESVEPLKINLQLEKRHLFADGWLTIDSQLTEKSKILITEIEQALNTKKISRSLSKLMGDSYMENIIKYRKMFPKRVLPSGKAAWSSPVNLEQVFTWFFKKYKYDWLTIFKATQMYLEKQNRENWKYCRTSQYFVKKDDSSDLADMCEVIKTGASKHLEEPTFKTKVV